MPHIGKNAIASTHQPSIKPHRFEKTNDVVLFKYVYVCVRVSLCVCVWYIYIYMCGCYQWVIIHVSLGPPLVRTYLTVMADSCRIQ